MTQKAIKELTVIKQLIELEDWEALSLMTQRIKDSEYAKSLAYLTSAVENQRFEDALLLIEDFERQGRQVALHYDPIVSALKVELHFQENELNLLLADREELAKRIDHFQIRYHNAVGEFLDRVLYLRKEKLRLQAITNPALKALYEAAEKDYNDYHAAHTSPITGLLFNLSEKEQIEIKRLYRKSSMICHPDRVTEECKEKAQAMFEELHEAYMNNDIRKVRLISELLEKTGRFETLRDKLDTAEALRAQIELVVLQVEETEADIKEIKSSQAYRTVDAIEGDWNDYFEEMVQNLKTQIADLEKWHLLHGNPN